ncbi:PTS sugar transporter subunit IIA [Marinilactibacillus psychrotolerans]|uniref:PTS sugar transporter subunit IIA n=1 Tax=Marinilactibacillus psychrotolerans TaxID=191770 RepID=A0ABW8UKW0_9LACT
MLIDKDYIFNKEVFKNKEEVFEKLGKRLEEDNIVQSGFVKALKEREADYPTGLPVEIGVAIPHTDGTLVNKDKLIFVTLEEPVSFNEMGGEDEDTVEVSIVIMLAVGNGKKHLETLTKLINTIQNKDFVEQLYSTNNKEEMHSIIVENIDL